MMHEMKLPLSRLRRLPPLVREGDDALAAGRPLLGVPRVGRASGCGRGQHSLLPRGGFVVTPKFIAASA